MTGSRAPPAFINKAGTRPCKSAQRSCLNLQPKYNIQHTTEFIVKWAGAPLHDPRPTPTQLCVYTLAGGHPCAPLPTLQPMLRKTLLPDSVGTSHNATCGYTLHFLCALATCVKIQCEDVMPLQMSAHPYVYTLHRGRWRAFGRPPNNSNLRAF